LTQPAPPDSASSVAVPGNELVRERLAMLADAGRLHPCLLFEGPSGVGKAATALWLARRTNCTSDTEAHPCGACWSCRQIPLGHHPDVVRVGVDPERTAPVVSVRQAREITASLVLRPYHARRRFIIIDPADAMTGGAANALLKTFEEPPVDTGFILISSAPSSLLATVRSRSWRVRFGPVAEAELVPWLQQQGVENAPALARLAEGSPGRALALAEGEAAAQRAARDEIVDALDSGVPGLLALSERLVKGSRAAKIERVVRAIDAVEALARDALVVHARGPGAALVGTDRPELAEQWARRLGLSGVSKVAAAARDARADLARFVNPRLLLDNFLARVALELGAPQ
jgi:DNA polymerase III subunit delta'